jgi:hypothetical protein
MKNQQQRLSLINEYELSPDSAFFSQETVAAIRNCSLATIERDRWVGSGVPFVKMGRLVRYSKKEIRAWLDNHIAFQSTTQAQYKLETKQLTKEAKTKKETIKKEIIKNA